MQTTTNLNLSNIKKKGSVSSIEKYLTRIIIKQILYCYNKKTKKKTNKKKWKTNERVCQTQINLNKSNS